MRAFRIALRKYGSNAKDAFSGLSGYSANGRWHSLGRFLDYAAESRSLATLERLVHYKRFDGLKPHVIYIVDIPDSQITSVGTPPPGWDGEDLLPGAQKVGDGWCDSQVSPGLLAPSAITPGENNLLINTHHMNWDWAWVGSMEPFEFNSRLAELLRKAQ
jgi:RES domain-containing protein